MMTPTRTDRRLWHRLEGYSFHERPLKASLVDRLHDETGHPLDICYTLVEEYRRFMYLAGSTAENLSPSPIVDLVWRLHTEDERAYFEDFCPRILGRTIYRPEGVPLPNAFHEDPDYVRTLEYYAREFGRPQVQYWPDPDVALERISHFLFWTIAFAAFVLAAFFKSVAFACFGIAIVFGIWVLRWKLSSLPLQGVATPGQ